MNFLNEEQFNAAMSSPSIAAESVRMLCEDFAVLLAILGGPEATPQTHSKLMHRCAEDILAGASFAKQRIDDSLSNSRSIFIPRGTM